MSARFSSRPTRTTFSRCSPQVFPTSVQTGAKHPASVRSPGSSSAAQVAPARHAEGGDLGLLELLGGQQLEELEVLRVRAGEARLDQVDAEGVQAPGDAHLLGGRERHALPLHAVAQGRVVELDRAHVPCAASAGTGSSHSR